MQMAAMAIGPRHHRGNGNQFLLWWLTWYGANCKVGGGRLSRYSDRVFGVNDRVSNCVGIFCLRVSGLEYH